MAWLLQDAQRQRMGDYFPTRALGLSGVVMGLGAALSLSMPTTRMTGMGAIPMPMWMVMIGYVVYDSARLGDQTSQVGHAAHLGGTAFGALYYWFALRRRRSFRRA